MTAPASPARPRTRRADDDLRRRLDEQAVLIADLTDRLANREAEQAVLIAALTERLANLEAEQSESRRSASAGQREMLRRLEELRPVPWGPAHSEAASPSAVDDLPSEVPVAPADSVPAGDYLRVVSRVKALVRTLVPVGSVVAVASRGDESLVDLDGRIGWHYPRSADGRWAGYHPQDSAAAVAHLEELRRHGAGYVLFPATARWWLDHYAGLRRHLETSGRLILDREDTCALFALDHFDR
jgi:hypothetical protein